MVHIPQKLTTARPFAGIDLDAAVHDAAKMRRLFDRFDGDGDGRLSFEECSQFLHGMGKSALLHPC